jgi:glycerol 3-phosphatase-2
MLADHFDTFLLDLDGVVFRGGQALPGAGSAVGALQAMASVRFLTNNASRTPEQVAAHLRRLGVAADAQEVRTSAQAAVRLLAATVGPGAGRPVLVVGGDGLVDALTHAGFVPVWSAADEPIAVVQGFAPDLSWPALAQGCYALATGVPWVAANLDPTLPTEHGQAPGNGAFVAALATATGRTPISAGKPDPSFLTDAVPPGCQRALMVGDRLDTDMAAATAAGMAGALVLTGVSTELDVVTAAPPVRPRYILADLSDLLGEYAEPSVDVRTDVVRARVAQWCVDVTAATVQWRGEGTRAAAVRALAAASWAAADVGHLVPASVQAGGVEAIPAQR